MSLTKVIPRWMISAYIQVGVSVHDGRAHAQVAGAGGGGEAAARLVRAHRAVVQPARHAHDAHGQAALECWAVEFCDLVLSTGLKEIEDIISFFR